MNIIARDEWTLSAWMDVFRVLGVRACHPLWAYSGVPPEMVKAPDLLVKSSLLFWNAVWKGQENNWHFINSLQAYNAYAASQRSWMLNVITKSFDLLAIHYGQHNASALYQWADRNLIAKQQQIVWSTWATLFVKFFRGASQVTKLSPNLALQVNRVVKLHLGGLLGGDDDGLNKMLIELKQVTLSPVEQRMISLEINHLVESEDDKTVDLATILENVIGQHSAYLIWQQLLADLIESEIESLLNWGETCAVAINLPKQNVSSIRKIEKRISP